MEFLDFNQGGFVLFGGVSKKGVRHVASDRLGRAERARLRGDSLRGDALHFCNVGVESC